MPSLRDLLASIDADPALARVKAHLEAAKDAAHDLHHSLRVALWTLHCAEGDVDTRVAIAAALCHDLVNLPKDHPDRAQASERSSEAARSLLGGHFSEEEVDAIAEAVRCHSFSRGERPTTLLGRALQDADRLEAVGAIGILRTAAVGAALGARPFHPGDPLATSRPLDDREFWVDHFFTKLLGLHATMTTRRGREEARRRTETIHAFLAELGRELGLSPRPLGGASFPYPPTIRRAGSDDAAAVAQVFLAARATMTYLPVLHSDEATREFIRGVVGESDTFVALRDGLVVGFASLRNDWLEHLYVHPTCFGTGLGTRLFERAKAERPSGLQLWVFQENAGARRFYERHGCRVERLTDGRNNEEKLPDALYVWRVEHR